MREIYEATEGHVRIGVLSSNFATVAEAKEKIAVYNKAVHGAESLGLGAGDPGQWVKVANISMEDEVSHINQDFPAVCLSRGENKHHNTYINSLVKPSGTLGTVNIAIGVVSSTGPGINVPIKSAITLIKEMGGNAVKFFPMKGLETKEQYKAVAHDCADEDFIIRATGGINLDNFT